MSRPSALVGRENITFNVRSLRLYELLLAYAAGIAGQLDTS